MKCAYWEAKDNKIIGKLKAKEGIICAFARQLGIDTDHLKISYTYPEKLFNAWYGPNTIGIVEQDKEGLKVAINTQILSYYFNSLEGIFKTADAEESTELISKIYAMAPMIVLSEYFVENDPLCQSIIGDEDEGTQVLANMYIASRIRMSTQRVRELLISVSDPYIFMSYDEITEENWRDLFDSVTYHTETCRKNKTFWDAMVAQRAGKALEIPNNLDKIVSQLEKIYNTYIEKTVNRQSCV